LDEIEWPYYPIDRLAAALLIPERGNPMGLFSAYFDASGNSKDQPRVIVSGYIANYWQWKLFEMSWDRAHSDFGFQRPFHMSEFIAALEYPDSYKGQKNARSDYIAIAQNPERAVHFLNTLTNIQVIGVMCGVSAIVDLAIYRSVNSIMDLQAVIPPYALGARMCINNVRSWERFFHVGESVECVFESGDFGQGEFSKLMVDEGHDSPVFRKKKDFAGLEAADMYAWEQTHFLRKININPQLSARLEFRVLLNAIPKIHTHAPQEMLIKLCYAKGIDIRGVK
jgi:hypothetical protein